jgi:pyruvate,water dikinase
MGKVKEFLKGLFSKKEDVEPENVEELRLSFQIRYHNFKLLINANNKALEIMAEMEQALQGKQPFGMTFVRTSAVSVLVNVYQMVEKMTQLAPAKYDELKAIFNGIREEIDAILSEHKAVSDTRMIIPLSDISKEMTDAVGSKMANIGEIKNRTGLRVPTGFAVSAYAYQQFITHNDLHEKIGEKLRSETTEDIDLLYSLSSEIQNMIIRSDTPDRLEHDILEMWESLEKQAGRKLTMALRSSAIGEDSAGSSFAGQYRSELNVAKENALLAFKEVVASKYSIQAIKYRLRKGLKDEDIPMCVGFLEMVDAAAGGVTYSRNPIDVGDDCIFINSAWGLPKAVVDGSVDCDLFVVSRKPHLHIIHREIKDKQRVFKCYPEEGVCRLDISGDKRTLPSLSPEQVVLLAEIAVTLDRYYGGAQDIEWVIDTRGDIVVLQCRPLHQEELREVRIPESLMDKAGASLIVSGGISASSGAASGQVFFVDKTQDILDFPDKGIMVTKEALPRWASLLSKAAGIVCEHGSFAGHLANVAREFGIPALFGIPGIRDKLEQGQIVTLDANNRAIHRGKIDFLLREPEKQKPLMEGSPVFQTFKAVTDRIIPLSLLDPGSPEFKAVNCKTLHDITRFIHEKSVQEIFSFGKEHNFSERSSKQLFFHVPMHWWILNLDDGFKEEVKGKYVKLDNIDSIPMLAFWRGFTAVPWDGPPGIDGKGLISVMFQSTANTALTTGVKSRFAERNYFMISRHFCHLSQRLGYHFSTLEALAGDRKEENYVKFQFKGGAADYQRRIRRVHFIGIILEDHGFEVEITEDQLVARLEGYDLETLAQRIKILGYLSLHTRQIDMIMTNDAAVRHYREKFQKDIAHLKAPGTGTAGQR